MDFAFECVVVPKLSVLIDICLIECLGNMSRRHAVTTQQVEAMSLVFNFHYIGFPNNNKHYEGAVCVKSNLL